MPKEKGKVKMKEEEKTKEGAQQVEGTFSSIWKLLGLLTPGARWLCFFAMLMAFCAGLLYPFIAIVMGEITGSYHPRQTVEGMNARITSLFYQILVVAAILWFLGYAYYTIFLQIAEKVQFDLKTKYLRSLLE